MMGKIVGDKYFLRESPTDSWREVTSKRFDKAIPSKPIGTVIGHSPGCWPMVCETVAVHPDQIEEARQAAVDYGVPTEFTKLGQPIFNDATHRYKYIKSRGFHDKNGGYNG